MPLRIVFLGYQTWGYVTLQALLTRSRHVVPLVFTHPPSDDPYERIWPESVVELATHAGVSVCTCQRLTHPDLIERVRQADPDLLLASNWRTRLTPAVLRLARLGAINLHDGLLPGYGGFAPINWAIINGERTAGVTAHFMTDELDLGDIILQEPVPISATDTAATVVARTFPLFADLALQAVDAVERATIRATPQDRSRATFYHKRAERDSQIDWARSPHAIYDLIRAQADPYPNAYSYHRGRKLFIKRACFPERAYCGTPGRIVGRTTAGVVVLGGAGPDGPNQGIVLEIVQAADGESVPASRYFRRLGEDLG